MAFILALLSRLFQLYHIRKYEKELKQDDSQYMSNDSIGISILFLFSEKKNDQ